ncbi:MAG: preprotein translocase subunit SecY [Deltaproteobacteria bacterium]|nr:preprotein translocase subunit SecY [Deltaproteobacteria bacterium]MCB9479004.1 preprotein translocase subunit SecY [Deltaproteobacteria bacterium]MCB9487788.1 preprotein translocase subunit SecY [Deltaproteobacteria bacterium]
MLGAFANIWKIPELKRRILVTLALLAVYRIGTIVPIPGLNTAALADFFESQQGQGNVFGMFSMFTGGALRRGSIFALSIMPYISASIILQLLTVVVPYLEKLSKEGEAGRRKITQYTRYGTVVLALFQGFMMAVALEKGFLQGQSFVNHPGVGFKLLTAITMTAGTAFIMWLGEQISEFGIGNGISLIIFAGIVANMPSAVFMFLADVGDGTRPLFQVFIVLPIVFLVVYAIIYVERAYRKIPIQHARRVIGRRMYGGASTHLPLKVNTAGVIPPIFASSILMFPATITQFSDHPWVQRFGDLMNPGGVFYNVVFVVLIVFFCYFYTAVTFNPVDVADNLKKSGAYIPGYRPGKRTADYIDRVLTRITLGGAFYVALVCVLPTIMIAYMNVPFYFGGTALLIVVGVALDTVAQIESHMLSRHYEGFLGGKGRFKGRR